MSSWPRCYGMIEALMCAPWMLLLADMHGLMLAVEHGVQRVIFGN